MPSFTYVTQLDADSSNIINVIKKGYEDVISFIEFQHKSHDSIEIEYYSTCNDRSYLQRSLYSLGNPIRAFK